MVHCGATLRQPKEYPIPDSLSPRSVPERAWLGFVGIAAMGADLLLVYQGHVLTWWRLAAPAIGVCLVLRITSAPGTVLGLRRIAARSLGPIIGLLFIGLCLWLTTYPSPFHPQPVNCRLTEDYCTAPYWIARQIRQLTVLAPLVEESVYRALGFGALAEAIGPIAALVISSAAFGYLHHLYHNFEWWKVLAGMGFAGLYWYTRSLALNVATHAAMNWAFMLRSLWRWYRFYGS